MQGPGHAFIIAAVILDRVYLKSARALTATRILLLPAEAVRQAFAADAAFCRRLGQEMALSYRTVVKELKNQKLRSSLERVANCCWPMTRRPAALAASPSPSTRRSSPRASASFRKSSPGPSPRFPPMA